MPTEPRRVLVVDDEPALGLLVKYILEDEGFVVRSVVTAAEAQAAVVQGFRGVVILDVGLPDLDGAVLFSRLMNLAPENPVIFLTSQGNAAMALDAVGRGAFDFIDKGSMGDRLVGSVRAAFATTARRETLHHEPLATVEGFPGIIAQSAAMQAALESARPAMNSLVPVLLLGESGTGKELVAKALHAGSVRRNGPFTALNCASIPETLLESELFGYEGGAFTGARHRKPGRFDLARGGTLLLDEIGDMPVHLQAKLLRILQEGTYERLGGVDTLKADVRIISATNRDLEKRIRKETFRSDLYFRLAVFTVRLPPLRERRDDIRPLVSHLLQRVSRREGRTVDKVDPIVMDLLESHDYPGNVRELENVLAYGVMKAVGGILTTADLPPALLRSLSEARQQQPATIRPEPASPRTADPAREPPPAFDSLEDRERDAIQDAMQKADGNKAEAARLLGISRMTLYRKLRQAKPKDNH